MILSAVAFKRIAYDATIGFVLFFALCHLLALPIGITYDGFYYLDLADVLGSIRFPAAWHPTRTPLYPLALKFSFWALGRQPLAAMLVSTVMGTGTILLLGRVTRVLVDPLVASGVLLLLTFYPTGIAYEHLALTETGTSLFIALLLTIAMRQVLTMRQAWFTAAAYSVVLTAGYYWRQLLLQLAPPAAILWLLTAWKVKRATSNVRWGAFAEMFGGAAVIIILPSLLSHGWDRYVDRAALSATTLRQGVLRQALLAPDDPHIGTNRQMYVYAIVNSSTGGNFFSGVRNDFFDPLFGALFRDQPADEAKRVFVHGIVSYPGRYAAGVFRTLMLFGGAKATVNENRIFRAYILSPTWTGSKIGDGPPELDAKIKAEFHQITTWSAVAQLLWNLCPAYDVLLMIANTIMLLGFGWALCIRNYNAIALTIFPLTYVGCYAAILASIDRFAVPAYPFSFATAVILPAILWRQWQTRRATASRA